MEAQAQILIEQERARLAEEARLREATRLEEERLRQETEFGQRLGAARNSAEGWIRSAFEQRGEDPNAYQRYISDELNRRQGSVPHLAADPGSYFDAVADAVVGNVTNWKRRDYTNAFDQFAAPGFAREQWANTADDALIDQLISEQFNPAAEQLLGAQRRGALTDAAYQSALAQLQNDRTTVGSRLQGIGGGLLETYRQGLRDIASEGRQGAAGYELGRTFNPMAYQARIDALASDQQGQFEGDLRRLIGNDPLFDTSNIIQTQQSQQGVTSGQSPTIDNTAIDEPLIDAVIDAEIDSKHNTLDSDKRATSPSLLNAFAAAELRRRHEQGRGLGQQGRF